MKRTHHRLWFVALAVGLALAITVPVQAAETYQLGLSLAITGPTSDAGNPYSKGVEDYMRLVNETEPILSAPGATIRERNPADPANATA